VVAKNAPPSHVQASEGGGGGVTVYFRARCVS
jgi:hypothetical protein